MKNWNNSNTGSNVAVWAAIDEVEGRLRQIEAAKAREENAKLEKKQGNTNKEMLLQIESDALDFAAHSHNLATAYDEVTEEKVGELIGELQELVYDLHKVRFRVQGEEL